MSPSDYEPDGTEWPATPQERRHCLMAVLVCFAGFALCMWALT